MKSSYCLFVWTSLVSRLNIAKMLETEISNGH